MGSTKEGSMIEGIVAMYIACVLSDKDDGKGKKTKDWIRKLRKRTTKVLSEKGTSSFVVFDEFFPGIEGIKSGKDVFFGNPVLVGPRNTSPTELKKYEVRKKKVGGKIKTPDAGGPNRRKRAKGQKDWIEAGNPPIPYFIQIKDKNTPDFVRVHLKVKLKAKEVDPAYGKALGGLSADEDFGELDTKIENLLEHAPGSNMMRDIIRVKNRYLKNTKEDVVNWQVEADGVTGETTGDATKADVFVRMKANGELQYKNKFNISLKSDNPTVSNLGVNAGAKKMYELLGVPSGKESQAKMLLKSLEESKGDAKLDAVSKVFDLIEENLLFQSRSRSLTFTNRAYDFIEYAIFGSDNPKTMVFDLKKSQNIPIKEIKHSQFKKTRERGSVKGGPIKLQVLRVPAPSGGPDFIAFYEYKPGVGKDKGYFTRATDSEVLKNFLFKVRYKRRKFKASEIKAINIKRTQAGVPKSQLLPNYPNALWVEKVLVELGPLAYK